MLKVIKRILPKPVKRVLITTKMKTYDRWQKKRLFNRMQLKHAELLQQIKGKEKIKVVFLAIHKSVWKVDPVFQKMLKDPLFEPEILVCPYTPYGEERMLEDMEQAYTYFLEKGYPIRKSRNEDGSWIKLEELKPDLVFFTNPHNLTCKEYYEDAYLNYLSCYVPYGHSVSKYNNYISQYNQFFHNAMWAIFVPHSECSNIYKHYSAARGKNVIVTGYPGCEEFFYSPGKMPWKCSDKLKVIWAPHHTISSPDLPYSNFLKMAEDFVELTKKYKNSIGFAFKPHPILKSNLFQHPDWGVKKTNSYYEYWEYAENTQLELGEYVELFKHSDALIHDSGSFIAEYHYVKKPVLYIYNSETKKHLNPFGVKAMESSYLGSEIEDVDRFLKYLIDGCLEVSDDFYEENIIKYFRNGMPSTKIVEYIKISIS